MQCRGDHWSSAFSDRGEVLLNRSSTGCRGANPYRVWKKSKLAVMVGHTKASPAEKLSSERETDEESKLSKTKFCKAVWRPPHSSFASQNPPSPLEKAYLNVSFVDKGEVCLMRSPTGCRGSNPYRVWWYSKKSYRRMQNFNQNLLRTTKGRPYRVW